MGFLFATEAFRFHKLKDERFVQLLFIITLSLNMLMRFLPWGSSDTTGVETFVNQMLSGAPLLRYLAYPPILSHGNLIMLGGVTVAGILNLLFSYAYASAYTAERDDLPAAKGLQGFFRTLPRLLLLIILLLVPALFSLAFFAIPMIIAALMLLFAPLLVMEQRMPLNDAIEESISLTDGHKGTMFFSFIILELLASFINSILSWVLQGSDAALTALSAVVVTLLTLMRGRLAGILYYVIGKQARYVSLNNYYGTNVNALYRDVRGEEPPDRPDQDDWR